MTVRHCNDSTDLFEVVKGGEDDVMTSSHQTHGRQQLQHQSFSPEKMIDVYALPSNYFKIR